MAQNTRPGNLERGWNDPPEFLHVGTKAAVVVPPTKRTTLNKRVAFPDSRPATGVSGGEPPARPPTGPSTQGGHANTATNSTDTTTASTNAPPLASSPPRPVPPAMEPPTASGVVLFPPAVSTDIPRFTAPIIVPTMSPKEESPIATVSTIATHPVTNTQVNMDSGSDQFQIPDFDNDEQMYHFVVTRLKKTSVDCEQSVKPRVIEDINRKLEIFSQMWKNGKISYPVKSSMARLATALHRRKCDAAHQIHLSLMMDYVSEVGQWMVGIKRLIQEARGIEAPLSPTDTTANTAVLHVTSEPTAQALARLGLTQEEGAGTAETPADGGPRADQPDTEGADKDSAEQQTPQSTTTSESHTGPAIIDTSPITN